ncbi:hypothetical protein [Pedobacter montanisoli]|uniref:Uncharacterized protein n=1 Tax=Pedobacter montanisoli TaxID=2923277 RepID=A0ABS9ZZK2_9SPHI|nr:hypothetical protein [Pedobacter montanisoli]MCJ0743722.1 hypothetical protein [Pedobacter montanisoli]
MNTDKEKEKKISQQKQKTVRGSGFTYNEDQQSTDQSIPLAAADKKQVVRLPKLGKKYRI